MNLTKIALSVVAIMAVAYCTYFFYTKEQREEKLQIEGEVVYVEIIELSCGKRDLITFRYDGKAMSQRIYLSAEECAELKAKDKIGIKIGKDETIVFADANYNNSSKTEMIAILLVGAFFIFCFAYYGISPELKKKNLGL